MNTLRKLGKGTLMLLGAIIIVIGAIPFLIWAAFQMQLVPYLGEYATYKAQTEQSPDETLHTSTCGDLTLTVEHTDAAVPAHHEGTSIVRPPSIEHTYTFKALKYGTPILELKGSLGKENMIAVEHSLQGSRAVQNLFIVDAEGFKSLNSGGVSQEASLVTVAVTAGIPKEDVENIARCYAKSTQEINEAWQQPIAAFAITQGNARERTVLTCPNERTVEIESGYVRIDGQVRNLIGQIGAGGIFSSFRGDVADGVNNLIPFSQRNLEYWGSCTTVDGKTLTDFVKGMRMEIIDVSR